MIEIGRICIKTAGRDAGRKCVIVDLLDKNFVIVDGETRRKRSNLVHLEPLSTKLDIKKNASSEEVRAAFKAIGIDIKERKPKAEKQQAATQENPIHHKIDSKKQKK
ncbi:50S ribosomal protein L14e [Candidatus Woesearchaeota archaeon]|nr:50S ribosomal protein L14e [Candidatus Woesearchaeota archaeon]